MKKNLQFFLLFSIIILFLQSAVSAQVNYFSKTYGSDSLMEHLSIVKELPSGGYIMLGESDNYKSPREYGLNLIKTDAEGKQIFLKNILNTPISSTQLILTINPDGGYTIEKMGFANKNWEILVTDSGGNFISNKIFSFPIDTFTSAGISSVKRINDNGYILLGQSKYMRFLLRTDKNFNTLWTKEIFQNDTLYLKVEDFLYDNNKFIIAANSTNQSGFILAQFDDQGNRLAEKYYLGKRQAISKIIPAADGNYFLSGYTSNQYLRNNYPMFDIIITKFTPQLDTLWSKLCYSEEDTSSTYPFTDRLGDIESISDGGAIIYFLNTDGYNPVHRTLFRIDKNGNKLWERNLSDKVSVFLSPLVYYDLIVSVDGGFGLVGSKMVYSTNDYYFLKTNTYGLMSGIKEADKTLKNEIFIAYPNPSSGDVTILFAEKEAVSKEIVLYDITGREIRRYSKIKESNFVLQREGLEKGIYLLRVINAEGKTQQAKLIFE